MFRKILIATDLRPLSEVAVRAGLQLAREQGAHVVLMTVVQKPHEADWFEPLFDAELASLHSVVGRLQGAAETRLEERMQAERAGAPEGAPSYEVVVRVGRAAAQIVEVGAELGVDLIVMSTRGRVGTIGSTAEQVVREAHRPVLVIPQA